MNFEQLRLCYGILLLQDVLAGVCHGAAILPVRWSISKMLLVCQLHIPSFCLSDRRCKCHPNTEQISLGSSQRRGLMRVASAAAETFAWRRTTDEVECCNTLWSVAHSDVFHLMFGLCSLASGFHSFVKDAKTQYEKLQMRYSERTSTVLGQYFLFDLQKMAVNSIFIELNNFRNRFLVSKMLFSPRFLHCADLPCFLLPIF